ncbi:hypothetical protein M0802_007755 [Mischocyttarus mexicanus]|nr:hypothetical protein M0802_007755 [Mischocyttarus mexicanus]
MFVVEFRHWREEELPTKTDKGRLRNNDWFRGVSAILPATELRSNTEGDSRTIAKLRAGTSGVIGVGVRIALERPAIHRQGFLDKLDDILASDILQFVHGGYLVDCNSKKSSSTTLLVGEGGPLTFLLKVSLINPAHIVELSRGNPQCFCDTPYGLL